MTSIDLDPTYLHPSDAVVRKLYEDDGDLWIRFLVPDTDGDAAYELEARVERASEAELELPMDDLEEPYD